MNSNRYSTKDSLRQRSKNLAKTTEDLGGQIQRLAGGVDQVLKQQNGRLSAVEETVLALVETIGIDEVQAAVADLRKRNNEARIVQEAEQLKRGIEDGYVIADETVTEQSFVIGVEHDKDAKLLGYGAQQCSYNDLPEAFKTLLLGKKAGEIVETPTGGKFELTGVYHVDGEKMQAFAKAKAEETAKAEEAAKADQAPAADTSEQTA